MDVFGRPLFAGSAWRVDPLDTSIEAHDESQYTIIEITEMEREYLAQVKACNRLTANVMQR
jgi:hypothetical protein